MHQLYIYLLVWAAAYLLAISLSGVVVRLLLRLAQVETVSNNQRISSIIGKLENVLVITFVALDAFTGLALIFAAKNLSRMDHRNQKEVNYFFLGTLGNFTWSLLVALAAKLAMLYLGISLPLDAIDQIS